MSDSTEVLECYMGGGGEVVALNENKPEERIAARLRTCTNYMNSYYPTWKHFSFKQPVLPSVFVPKYRGSVDPLASNYGQPPDGQVRGDNAEIQIFQLFSKAITPESGMLALRGMDYISFQKSSLEKLLSEQGEKLSAWSGEFSDFILFDKVRGISLIEIKSIGSTVESAEKEDRCKAISAVLADAKLQLKKSSKCLKILLSLISPNKNDWPCFRKMLFIPSLPENAGEFQNLFEHYLADCNIFFEENLTSSDSFLQKYQEICKLERSENEPSGKVLQDLLSVMVCTAVNLTFEASWELSEKLRMQDVYTKNEKKAMESSRQVIRIPRTKCHIYLTPEQNQVFRRPASSRLVLDGAPGSGKTILMQMKALELANSGKTIACFCGTVPLAKLYLHFFEGNGYTFTQLPLECSGSGFRLLSGEAENCVKERQNQAKNCAVQKGSIFVISLPWISSEQEDPSDIFLSAMIDLLKGFTTKLALKQTWANGSAASGLLTSISGVLAVLTTGAGSQARSTSTQSQDANPQGSLANWLLQLAESAIEGSQESRTASSSESAGETLFKYVSGNFVNWFLQKVADEPVINDLNKVSVAVMQTALAKIFERSSAVSIFMDECSHHAFQHVASKLKDSNLRIELVWVCLAFFGLSALYRECFNEQFQGFEWIQLKTVMRYTKTLFDHYKKIKCFEDMHLGHSCLGAVLPDKIEMCGTLPQCVNNLSGAVKSFLDANCKNRTSSATSKTGWHLESVGLLLDYWTPFLSSKGDTLKVLKNGLSEKLGISIVDINDVDSGNSDENCADRLVCFRQLNSLGLEYLAVIVILIKEEAGMLDSVPFKDLAPMLGPVVEFLFPPTDHPFAVFTPSFTRCNVLLQCIYVTITPEETLIEEVLD